jgi:hypothetical protein
MKTIDEQTAPQTASKQHSTAEPQRKGGFVKGAAVAQGCCGETSGGSSGCYGTPTQAAVPDSSIPVTAQGGCCGAPASTTQATSTRYGCCG